MANMAIPLDEESQSSGIAAESSSPSEDTPTQTTNDEKQGGDVRKRRKWTLGIMSDRETEEVPGSILLLSKVSEHNAPLGLQRTASRTSTSSRPSIMSNHSSVSRAMFGRLPQVVEKKKTKNGKIILEPQPDESANDPLNWSALRRDAALLSLGLYCMIGGGMTPILAAGFTNVSETYDVSVPQVALTTGLYMMGLGVGSVIASPTAIAFGKRPVYLLTSIMFLLSAVWCALSPNYASLVVARVFQGLSVSPVECLPSATIAEIFFLHERAYRLGIYTLLLLGGKNLVPLVSAAIIQSLGWRWVFWVVAIVVGFCFCLLFFFVPETFWDRTPRPHKPHRRPSFASLRRMTSPRIPGVAAQKPSQERTVEMQNDGESEKPDLASPSVAIPGAIAKRRREKHARFAPPGAQGVSRDEIVTDASDLPFDGRNPPVSPTDDTINISSRQFEPGSPEFNIDGSRVMSQGGVPATPQLHNLNSPYYSTKEAIDYFSPQGVNSSEQEEVESQRTPVSGPTPSSVLPPILSPVLDNPSMKYTRYYQSREAKTFAETLKPYSGRLGRDNWFRVAFRPFVLFAYPAILWSSAVYALSVGWLIVLSESVSTIYRNPDTYNFSAIATGLVYISPFIGGILGTAVAGKVSDVVVRFAARRNGGIYEPEFRLFMALPVALSTVVGLMGFGWSAQERDNFWVPTIFFGVISFGCSLGSTTAITFAVDSYRQYAGEALVTLNWSKNIFHGLVFSLFFNSWLDDDGSKLVFICLGGIQLFFLLWTVPMYVFGKRARMWTVRRNLMEKF